MEFHRTSRIAWVDIAKGICIILMVLGHVGVPFVKYIYLFHMSAFLILSGFTGNHDKYTMGQFLVRKILTLVVPFYLINFLFVLGYAAAQYMGLSFCIPPSEVRPFFENTVCLFQPYTATPDLGGAMWFLIVLFWSELICHVICAVCKKLAFPKNVDIFLMVLLSGLGWFWIQTKAYLPWNIDLGLLACLFYAFGLFLRRYEVLEKHIEHKTAIPFSIIVCVFFAEFYFSGLPTNWPTRDFPSWGIMIVCALSGFYLCYCIANLLMNTLRWSDLLQYVGRNTFPILAWHFLLFRILNLAFVIVGHQPVTILQELTPTMGSTFFKIVYAFITIGICLTVSKVASRTRLTNYIVNASWTYSYYNRRI